MSNLTETSTFPSTVNKIDDLEEITEALLNLAAQALTNRTRYLLDQLALHANASAPHSGHETPTGAQTKVNVHAATITGAHGATSEAWGNYPVNRDVNGRAKFVGGVSANQAVTFDQFGLFASGAGYQRLPSGLIIQWTTVTGNGTFPWPLAFGAILHATVRDISGFVNLAEAPYSYTTTGFTHTSIQVNSAVATGVTKTAFAIGY